MGEAVPEERIDALAPARSGAPAARVPARARGAVRRRGYAALRVRRAHRVSPRADGSGAAGDGRAGAARAADLLGARRAGSAARRGHRTVRRGAAVGRRGAAFDGQVHARPARRPGRAPGGGAAGRAQCRHLGPGGAVRALLRARPLEPDCVLDRRQRGRELGRGALPQVRPDGAQRNARAGLYHRRRAGRLRQRGARRAGLRLARARDRLRGAARGDHRGDGQAAAQAAARARGDGVVRRRRDRRQGGRRGDRGRNRSRGPGNDGQAGHARGGGVRARRLRPRRGGDPAVRVGRHAGGGGGGDRARQAGPVGRGRDAHDGLARRGRAAALLVRAQGGVPGRRAHLARLLLHGRNHPAPSPGRDSALHRRDGESSTACAARTCSTPATATCTR